MKKNKLFIYIIVLFVFSAVPAYTAELFFDSNNKDFKVGQTYIISLYLNTQREAINALEAKIIIPTDYLELIDIKEENSMVSFWVDKPAYLNKIIFFSGIIPGGYLSDKGQILNITVKAKKTGLVSLSLDGVQVLLDDGRGTEVFSKTTDYILNIIDNLQDNEEESKLIVDTSIPEIFVPEVSSDPNLFAGKNFVVFYTKDNGSGVDRYEIKESKYDLLSTLFGKWKEAENPYVLMDQTLHSNIFIKAIDRVGNVRLVKIPPKNAVFWYENLDNWFIIITIVIMAVIYGLINNVVKHGKK